MIPQTEKLVQFLVQNISDRKAKTKMVAIRVLSEWLAPTDPRLDLVVSSFISTAGA